MLINNFILNTKTITKKTYQIKDFYRKYRGVIRTFSYIFDGALLQISLPAFSKKAKLLTIFVKKRNYRCLTLS